MFLIGSMHIHLFSGLGYVRDFRLKLRAFFFFIFPSGRFSLGLKLLKEIGENKGKKHELESRLLGEIPITSDMQMTPP